MKIQIDLKSALCGLLAGVAVMLCAGAGESSNPVGRYQVTGAASPNGSIFVIVDTQTGAAWPMDSVKDWGNQHPGQTDVNFWQAKHE